VIVQSTGDEEKDNNIVELKGDPLAETKTDISTKDRNCYPPLSPVSDQ